MIELKYDKSATDYLTAEDKALLLAFVNHSVELEHIATFKGNPKVLTVNAYEDELDIGCEEDNRHTHYYYISKTFPNPHHPQDQRFREYALTNSLKRFTA